MSIEVSCDGENFVDYEVGGTPVVEAMIATGTSIISIESPCIYMRPKYVVNSITGNATVACFINAKD